MNFTQNTWTVNYLNASVSLNLSSFDDDIDESQRLKDYKQKLLQDTIIEILAFAVFQVIGGTANLFVFYKLCTTKYRNSQMNYLLRHLTFADLIVIFVTITIEIVWRLTISWNAGELMCKTVLTTRLYGLYLSSMILIVISVDRYFAFVHPMSFKSAKDRNRKMLAVAHLLSFILSLPQAFIYHIERHPNYKGFEQCMSDNYFDEKWKERVYNVISVSGLYFLPLIVVVICYAKIIFTLHQNGHNIYGNNDQQVTESFANREQLITRAKRRTLQVGLTVTLAFIVCWSPYAFMVFAYQFSQIVSLIPPVVNELCFAFAVSNSVVNPFVHSSHLFSELKKSIVGPQSGSSKRRSRMITGHEAGQTTSRM